MKIYLDLLPKQRKSELKRKRLFRKILRQEFLFMLPVILFIIILLNIYYLLTIQRDISIAVKSTAESQDKYQELSSYEEKFKQVNLASAKLLKIQSAHLHWATVLGALGQSMPEGVAITDFSTKDYKIFLIGSAKNRDMLLNFKSNLEGNGCFTAVNVPLSNLVVKDDINFQMDLSIKDDCLKKQ